MMENSQKNRKPDKKENKFMPTEYRGAGPSCSVDSRFGSFPPRNNEISSVVDRLKQLPTMIHKQKKINATVPNGNGR